MNPYKWKLTCVAALSLIWLAGVAPARADTAGGQTTANQMIPPEEVVVTSGPSSYVMGTVVTSTPEMLTIREPDGQTRDFALDEHRGYGAAMIPGDRVRVEYAALDSRENVAKNVETLDLLAELNGERGSSHAAAAPTANGGAQAAVASPTASSAAASSEASMPATASPLPAVLATGALLLAAGVGVRLIGRG